jgi:hypothetical protein
MVKFRDAKHLADYLRVWEEDYASYAHNLWEDGIRSTEMLSRTTTERIAATLAQSNQPSRKHTNYADDMIRLARDAKPSDADMCVGIIAVDPAKANHEVQQVSGQAPAKTPSDRGKSTVI